MDNKGSWKCVFRPQCGINLLCLAQNATEYTGGDTRCQTLFTSFTRSARSLCARTSFIFTLSNLQIIILHDAMTYTERWWWQPRISRLVRFPASFCTNNNNKPEWKGKNLYLQICHSFYLPHTHTLSGRRAHRDLPTTNLDRFWEFNPILCTHHKKMITRAANGAEEQGKKWWIFFW